MTVTVYRAEDGWRWRLTAANGNVIAESGEAYARKPACVRMATRIRWAEGALIEPEVVIG